MAALPTGANKTGPKALDGAALRRAYEGGASALETQRDSLNAINVFPVPDGDTGTNMSLTMRAAVTATDDSGDDAPGVTKAAGDGALMGARGNSGVILSQILAGIAAEASADYDGEAIAQALQRAREAAYRVISQPREGTILTAISAAAEAAQLSAAAGGGATDVLAAAAVAAQEATDRTPEMLPVLKEAGVVDAGAQGLAVMLDGMVSALRGDEGAAAVDLGAIDTSWLSATKRVHEGGEAAGFCTEFVVAGSDIDVEAVRHELSQIGDSLLVVGDASLVRVHVHTHTPDAAIAIGRGAGDVSREKVEDMEAQFREMAEAPDDAAGANTRLAVVVVAAGPGLEELFRSLGATGIVRGGQTMNPSAGEIRGAIAQAGGRETIVLPNNKNIVLAAQQASTAIGDGVRVVATSSIPQGVAALVALNTEALLEENIAAMEEASAAVRSGEVTLAARATTLGGIEVHEGQPIGLVDGELVAAEATIADAVRSCVERMLTGRDGAIVTLYAGDGEAAEGAEAIAAGLREAFACEVEVVEGGQPHYPYLIGVE